MRKHDRKVEMTVDRNRIRYLKDNFAATAEELTSIRLEGCSDTSVYTQLLQLRGRRDEEALCCLLIEGECKKTEKVIREEIDFIRKELDFLSSTNPPIEIDLKSYFRYGAYTIDVTNDREALSKWIDKLEQYLFLRDHIARKIEIERAPLSSFENELEEARILLSEILSRGRKKELFEAIKYIHPDLPEDPAEFDMVTLDMELSIDVLGFVPEEYVSYHFWEKSISQRLEYVSDRLRKRIGELHNPAHVKEGLDNKYMTYRALEPLYGRTIRQMDADGGYPAFEKAFRENPVLVKKNNFQSLGKEVEIIETTESTDLHALYDRVAENGRHFILEDLITPHPDLKRLNPDSVNTIRIVTFLDKDGSVILDSFLRIGRKGAFVDNGGAGGIFVHVDRSTGVTDSHGIDERGFFYDSHPDHSYPFLDIHLPLWDEAIETAKEAALRISEAGYVGWDLTCTEDGRWIIIEGNSMTMYIGQQATLGIGKRKEVLDAIHYEDLIG